MLSAPALILTLLAYELLAIVSAISGGHVIVNAAATAAVAGLIQVGLLWLSYRLFLKRPWWNRHLVTKASVVVLVVLGASAIAATLLPGGFGSADVGTENLGMWLQRAAALLLITAGWKALASFRATIERESELQERLRHSRGSAIEMVEQQRRDVVERIKEMLHATLENPALANRETLDEARARIRELSHELQIATPTYQPSMPEPVSRPGWRLVVERVLRTPVIRPLLMATTVTIFFISQTISTDISSAPIEQPAADGLQISIDTTSFIMSITYLAVVFFTTWALSALAVRLTGPRLASMPLGARALWVLVTPILLAVVVQGVIEVAYVLSGFSEMLSDDIADRLLTTIPIFVVAGLILAIRGVGGLFTLAEANSRELTQELTWEVARANETLTQERRVLSLVVHGPLQSTIASISLAIQENAAGSIGTTDEQARVKLQEVIDLLENEPLHQRSVRQETERVISTWAGVCEVEVNAQEEAIAALDRDWIAAGTVADVLIEAVANSATHGGASRAWITIEIVNPRTVEVTALNNGRSLQEDPETGLGTRLLNDVAISWERREIDDQVMLRVRLPIIDTDPKLAEHRSPVLDGRD